MNQSAANASWAQTLGVYTHPRVLGMMFLGFSAGLPYLLIYGNLATWLTDIRVPIGIVGFFSWISITYSIKVFWAPIVDALNIPLLTRWLGHRRSWMLLSQLGIACGLFGLSSVDPHANLWLLAWFGLLTAFSAATQDICVDAYRIEAVANKYQAAMASTYMFGYRFAVVVSGAGVLMISEFSSWSTAYYSMAFFMSVGIVTTLIIQEPVDRMQRKAMPTQLVTDHIHGFSPSVRYALKLLLGVFIAVFSLVFSAILLVFPVLIPALVWVGYKYRHKNIRAVVGEWFLGTVVGPIVDFIYRFGFRMAMLILTLILIYRISDLFMGFMANSLYIVLGFSKMEIAIYTKVFGVVMTLLGTFSGGIMVMRYGVMRVMLIGAILVASTNLLFTVLAMTGYSIPMLIILIIGDNTSQGVATAAFVAYLSSLVNKQYTATQYALFSSLMLFLGKFTQGFSGQLTAALGFPAFFALAAATGIPTILLIMYMIKLKHDPKPEEDSAAVESKEERKTAGWGKIALTYSFIPVLFAGLAVVVMLEGGVLQFNNPNETQYPARGLIVGGNSSVKWETLSKTTWDSKHELPYRFIYLQMTQGAGQVQTPAQKAAQEKYLEKALENWKEAGSSPLRYGALHAFDLCAGGADQARHILEHVPNDAAAMPMVIQVELTGVCPIHKQPTTEVIAEQLEILIQSVQAWQNKKPIVMVTEKAYEYLVRDHIAEQRLWAKNIVKTPGGSLKDRWLLWQYSARGLVEGVGGYARMSVFNGTAAEFNEAFP